MARTSIDLTSTLKRWLGLRGSWAPELVETVQPVVSLEGMAMGPVAPHGFPFGFYLDPAAPGAGLHNYCVVFAIPGMVIRVDRLKCFSVDNAIIIGKRTEEMVGAGAVHFAAITDSARWNDDTVAWAADTSTGLVLARVGSETSANIAAICDTIGEISSGNVWGQGDIPVAWLVAKKNGTPFAGMRTRNSNVAERYAISGVAFPL